MTPSVAEEATAPPAGNNKTCSNERSGEDKCSGCKEIRTRSRGPF